MTDVKQSQSPVQITESTTDELHDLLRNRPGTLFAILDACDEPRVPVKVKELGERAASLYSGWAKENYWAIAPYLVEVDEALLDWIVENLWDDPWGIFVIAETELADLRKHFRRFLMVEDPDGEPLYFRFYDPRVLLNFVEVGVPGEFDEFFGTVKSLVISDGANLRRFQLIH
ncbi:MAG: DUF4123 domain-containing protein [Planctomycetaceae bacterium]|nr:DUF4123 domain-containing protein [Planctomycetaceae bacterium]